MIERHSEAAASFFVSARLGGLLGLVALALLAPAGCNDEVAATSAELTLVRGGARVSPELIVALGTFQLTPDQEPTRVTLEVENAGEGAVDIGAPDVLSIESDSALAFRVSKPADTLLNPGQRAEIRIIFTPPAVGMWEATLVLNPPNARGGPKRYRMTASASQVTVVPDLSLSFVDDGGAPVGGLDFGFLSPGTSSTLEVRLRNDGNVPFDFVLAKIVTTDASAPFVVQTNSEGLIEPGGAVILGVAASPLTCGIFATTLIIRDPRDDRPLADLAIRVSSAPDLFTRPGLVTNSSTNAAERSIALAHREEGGARVVLGDSAFDSFRGKAMWLDFNGCESSNGQALNDSQGTGTNLWGHRVATDAEGKLALVTSSDRAEAWLLPMIAGEGAGAAGFRLGTFNSKGGHGQGAAFARDGSVAGVGQTLADSGFNPHGGVWLYRRPSPTAWADIAEADFRLVPLEPPRVSKLGSALAMSTTGDVIISGGLYMSSVTATDVFEAALFVWAASTDPSLGRTWGRVVPGQDGDRRAESFLLRSLKTPIEEALAVGASADGSVLAIAFKSDFTIVEVHIFETGLDGLWGIPGDPQTRRVANHVVSVDAFNNWGFALSPDGRRFIVSDDFGIVAVAKTGQTWGAGSALEQTWPTPLAGQVSFDPAGTQIGGFSPDGGLVIQQLNPMLNALEP